MSKIHSAVRFGPPTTESLQHDLRVERTILSRACADVETSVRNMARLAREPGAQHPVLGYRGALVQPAAIDRDALEDIRVEALRETRLRLEHLVALVDLDISMLRRR